MVCTVLYQWYSIKLRQRVGMFSLQWGAAREVSIHSSNMCVVDEDVEYSREVQVV